MNGLPVPIQRIPTELLERIFIYTYPKLIVMQQDLFPLSVTLVCRQWHALALSSAQLWSHIDVEVVATRQRQCLHNLEVCLNRSRRCLLSITVSQDIPNQHTPPEAIMMLLRHAHRWQSLVLNCDLFSYQCTRETEFPILERIYIIGDKKIPADLRRLSHLRLYWTLKPALLNDQWSRITHFHYIDGPSDISEICKVLNLLRNIQWLHIQHSCWDCSSQVNHRQLNNITLLQLQRLLLCIPYSAIQIILGKLIAPSLTVLHLFDNTQQPTWEYCSEFQSMLERSQCRIEDLLLWTFPLSVMTSVSQKLQHLKTLTIAFMEEQSGHEVVRRLLQPSKGHCITLPELRSFKFYYDQSYKKKNYSELIGSLHQRLTSNPSLREVALEFGKNMTKSVLAEGTRVQDEFPHMSLTVKSGQRFMDSITRAVALAPEICP